MGDYMEFKIDFDILTEIKRNLGDKIVLYSEDEKGFDLWMSLDNFILTSRVTLDEIKARNSNPMTFRNNLSRCLRVNQKKEIEHEHDREYLGEKLDRDMTFLKFIGWDFQDVNQYMIEFLKTYNFSLIKDITEKQRKNIKKLFMEVLLQRMTLATLEDGMRDILGKDKEDKIEAIIRTETIKISAESSLDRYKSMGVKKVRWIATIGSQRTCEVCLANHNKEFTIEEARGRIPSHPLCRCTFLPII